ncbi:hypothetical protein VNO77_34386 [Canavalia gladiata]|uniref:Uncharacterized protein n=1 Tax=Canavalia gladiata TaxID=3824 RepID=A0AAN9KGG1_CANGL
MDPSWTYDVCSFSNKSICIYDLIMGEMVAKASGTVRHHIPIDTHDPLGTILHYYVGDSYDPNRGDGDHIIKKTSNWKHLVSHSAWFP